MTRRWLVPLCTAVVVALVSPQYQRTVDQEKRRVDAAKAEEGGFEQYVEAVTLLGLLRSRGSAPFSDTAAGALAAAHASKDKMAMEIGRWQPLGGTPMHSDDPNYSISDLGHGTLSGRITALADDPSIRGHHYLSAAAGGVFETIDGGATWRSIGDKLQTQVVGALAYSPSKRLLIAGTGDKAFGGSSGAGLGVYRSTNNGRSWKKAKGVPDEILSFRVVFDPRSNGNVVYAATSKGLFRSTDAGVSFVNVKLPTSTQCTGNTASRECFFANIVTDVVVQQTDGKVMAAVGWRAGRARNKGDNRVQSPRNGIYVSNTGAPGSFAFVDAGETVSANGFAINPIVGRVALGNAKGLGQNHDIVYAIVQDASKFAGCIDVLDVNPVCEPTAGAVTQATVLDGAYVTTDFGQTWTKIMDWPQLRVPGTNSSLGGVSAQPTYGPGIQSWYNLWIEPDPTRTDLATAAPSRVLFGLEEVWQNTLRAAVTGPTSWEVIGRYWNACFGGVTATSGMQCNGLDEPIETGTTTHPDQQAVLFSPDGAGGVSVLVGNDGGVYTQHALAGAEFDNESWGAGANVGLNTLQMYDLAIARDGTATAGLQDNGQVKIEPGSRRSVAIYGGDGFDTGIDPDDSGRILEEYAEGRATITTDGGRSWTIVDPELTAPLFWTPLTISPDDANHFVVGGREIKERRNGWSTSATWTTAFDLGTAPSGANRQTSAIDVRGNTIYAGFCGYCDVVTQNVPFTRGIATNVGGTWHFAVANGLPVRYITSIQMDPHDPLTVYVTLGGYGRRWVPPGAVGENTTLVGEGHVFKSIDGAESFTNISGNLPDVPANWTVLRNGRLIVATDIGVFAAKNTAGGSYSVLGDGLPHAPVFKLRVQPGDENHLLAVTYGRGAWSYRFAAPSTTPAGTAQSPITGSVTTGAPAPLTTDAGLNRTVGDVLAAQWEFDVLSGFDNAKVVVNATYSLPADVDLFLQKRQADGSFVDVASGTTSRLDGELVQTGSPTPGRYRVLVENWAGVPGMTVNLTATFFNSANVVGK